MPGYETILTIPVDARSKSQTQVTGEKTYDNIAVPRDCTRKRTTRNACITISNKSLEDEDDWQLTIEMGMMSDEILGFATAIPPTALVTDTAGVKTPSANVKLVPKRACRMVSAERIWKKQAQGTQISNGHLSLGANLYAFGDVEVL